MSKTPMLFDLDGTLVHSLPDIAQSVDHVRQSFDLPPLGAAAVRQMVGDGLIKLLERALGEHFPDPDAAVELYREHHWHQCIALVEPFPGVVERLASWQAAGHPLAVVTNKPARFVHRILEHLQLGRWFDAVVCGDTTSERKPHPAPVLRALEILDRNPDGAVMVGDSPNDLHSGRAAGVRTVAALYGYGLEAELRSIGADDYWVRFGTT
jgi:phosphoglycolate phosphatase